LARRLQRIDSRASVKVGLLITQRERKEGEGGREKLCGKYYWGAMIVTG